MTRTFLSARRIARTTKKDLGDVAITESDIAHEADAGRGLLIAGCREEELLSHVCNTIRHSPRLRSLVVPLSHMVVEEIAQMLETPHGPHVWRTAQEKQEGIGNLWAPIWITIPENLADLSNCDESGSLRPSVIHVVDLALCVAIPGLSLCGRACYRAFAVGRYKAACQAHNVVPYVVLWTPEECPYIPYRYLCQAVGLEAWLYADGRSLSGTS